MSFSASTRQRTSPVLPLASMVDMMFLLLIFFVTTSTLRQHASSINVALPTAQTAQGGTTDATHVIVTISKKGQVYLGTHPTTLPKLRTTLTKLAKQSPNESVIIRGDKQSPLGLSVSVLDIARQAGLRNASLNALKSKQKQ